jgi:hypothetical protein
VSAIDQASDLGSNWDVGRPLRVDGSIWIAKTSVSLREGRVGDPRASSMVRNGCLGSQSQAGKHTPRSRSCETSRVSAMF